MTESSPKCISKTCVDTVDKDDNKYIITYTKEAKHHYVYLDEDIGSGDEYRSLFKLLRDATDDTKITFVINTSGGDMYTVVQLYPHMLTTKAKTEAEVHIAYSAGADITLMCDEVRIASPLSSLMIHNAYHGHSYSKANDIANYTEFLKDNLQIMADIIYAGFLTKSEIKRMLNGEDFWMNSEELERRLKKRKPIR